MLKIIFTLTFFVITAEAVDQSQQYRFSPETHKIYKSECASFSGEYLVPVVPEDGGNWLYLRPPNTKRRACNKLANSISSLLKDGPIRVTTDSEGKIAKFERDNLTDMSCTTYVPPGNSQVSFSLDGFGCSKNLKAQMVKCSDGIFTGIYTTVCPSGASAQECYDGTQTVVGAQGDGSSR